MTSVTKKEAKWFWKCCREYLESKTDLEFVAELAAIQNRQNPQKLSMSAFYLRFLKSLINHQGMPNSIGGVERFRDVFRKFSPKKVIGKWNYGMSICKLVTHAGDTIVRLWAILI